MWGRHDISWPVEKRFNPEVQNVFDLNLFEDPNLDFVQVFCAENFVSFVGFLGIRSEDETQADDEKKLPAWPAISRIHSK